MNTEQDLEETQAFLMPQQLNVMQDPLQWLKWQDM